MKPARSPRFQSPALRASSAAISAWGWPRGTGGAAHAVSAAATIHDAARTASLFVPGSPERTFRHGRRNPASAAGREAGERPVLRRRAVGRSVPRVQAVHDPGEGDEGIRLGRLEPRERGGVATAPRLRRTRGRTTVLTRPPAGRSRRANRAAGAPRGDGSSRPKGAPAV